MMFRLLLLQVEMMVMRAVTTHITNTHRRIQPLIVHARSGVIVHTVLETVLLGLLLLEMGLLRLIRLMRLMGRRMHLGVQMRAGMHGVMMLRMMGGVELVPLMLLLFVL